MKKAVTGILLVLAVSALSGCISAQILPRLDTAEAVPADRVVLTGRIIFDPEPEQTFTATGQWFADKLRKQFTLALTEEPTPKFSDYVNAAFALQDTWGEYFLVSVPRERVSWATVSFYLWYGGNGYRTAYLYSPFEISWETGDNFVYLGDFVYHFGATNAQGGKENVLEVKDGFSAARAKLEGGLKGPDGKPLVLQKRLPRVEPKLDVDVIETTIRYN